MKSLWTGITLILLFFVTADISADKLYTWTDEKGTLHITEHPPPENARNTDVITYKPQTETQIKKNEKDARREEIQDEAARSEDTRQVTGAAGAKTNPPDDEDVYIGREGKRVRRGEERRERREQRQDIRRENRYHRR